MTGMLYKYQYTKIELYIQFWELFHKPGFPLIRKGHPPIKSRRFRLSGKGKVGIGMRTVLSRFLGHTMQALKVKELDTSPYRR
jgi:hypothetical protein